VALYKYRFVFIHNQVPPHPDCICQSSSEVLAGIAPPHGFLKDHKRDYYFIMILKMNNADAV